MSERVSVIPGQYSTNVILVVPRGADERHVSVIAEVCADEIECHAIINRGFEKSDVVDVLQDKADCARISHVTQEVVYEEFLDPIKRIKERMVNRIIRGNLNQGNWGDMDEYVGRVLIFYLYGIKNIYTDDSSPISMVVGNGGRVLTSSYTSELWRRDLFVTLANDVWGNGAGETYVGHPRGKYAGRSEDNINQFFRTQEMDKFVESMQLSFPQVTRTSESHAICTGMDLAHIISKFLVHTDFEDDVEIKFI